MRGLFASCPLRAVAEVGAGVDTAGAREVGVVLPRGVPREAACYPRCNRDHIVKSTAKC